MKITNSEKKRFIKDYGLPIQLVQEPYFEYYINLLDPYFQTIEKYKKFKEVVKDQDNFLDFSQNLSKNIIDDIKNSNTYKEFSHTFSNTNMKDYTVPQNYIMSKQLYLPENDGGTFISIDIKKANFNSMKYFDSDMFRAKTYEELIEKYTDYEYFKESKFFRQVIFGNLSPKRQQKIQKFMIYKVYEKLEAVISNGIFSYSSDEIVIKVPFAHSTNHYLNVIKDELENIGFIDELRIKSFNLNNFYKDYYVREYKNKVEFKKCPSTFFMQIFKNIDMRL